MRMLLGLLVFIALFSVPAYAAGNMTVSSASLAPAYINTNTSTDMLNLTLNATVDTVNITAINVTVIGVSSANVTLIEAKNSTGSVIASSPINESTNSSALSISGFSVATAANRTLVISVILNSTASILSSISLNISASSEIGVDNNSNVSIQGNSVQSGSSQIQDVNANARVTPLFVDTSVVNQSIAYILEPVGRNRFSNISLVIPVQYSLVNVTEIKQGSNILYNSTTSIAIVSFNATRGEINVSNTASDGFGTSETIVVNISVNTSSSAVPGMAFNSSIRGSNISVAARVSGTNTTVTTQQLVSIAAMAISKSAAIANGTDYWEFNLTLNFSANVSGIVQFRLSNWTNGAGQTISLQDTTSGNITYYSSLRDSANSSRTTNITNNYNLTSGLSLQGCCTAGQLYTAILRMMIPLGTPSSSSWSSIYGILFRSS